VEDILNILIDEGLQIVSASVGEYGGVTVYSDLGGVKGHTPAQLNQRIANQGVMGIHFHINQS